MKRIMAMLEQTKHVEKEPLQSPELPPTLEPVNRLFEDLDKMIVEPIDELDVQAMLAKPIEFIKEDEYSENLLDDLLNNDDLLDELQDDPVIVATVRIIPIKFADLAGDSQYLKGDVLVEEAKCLALVEKSLKK